MTTEQCDSELRMAFRLAGPGGQSPEPATPAGKLRDAIAAVVACWNATIPKHRVRIVTQARYQDLRYLLNTWTPEEVCAGIEWYGKQSWNRQRQAWRTFDAWIDLAVATRWIEQGLGRREAEAEHPAPGEPAAAGRPSAEPTTPAEDGRAAFDQLRPDVRYGLLNRAKQALTPGLRDREKQVRLAAIALGRREGLLP
ncbi:MAG TPA: hypothetical protein VM238_03140 [Phycisphaerae bacterium]|nr:hypothetical protein [Phycisphaerae bacterium]